MYMQTKTISLTRRVIDHFLAYSLGCLFLSLVLLITLQWRGLLISHLHLVTIIPIICMSLGMLTFYKMFRVTENIQKQIRNLADYPEMDQFTPVYRPDPLARGWNMIVEKIGQQASSGSLESRICKSLGDLQSHKHQVAFDCFPDGLAITDLDGTITHSNRTFSVILHLDNGPDFEGKSLNSLLRFDQLENGTDILQKIKQQIVSLVFEIKPAWLEAGTVLRVSRHKLVDEQGNQEGYLWGLRDITQEKLAEEMRNQFVFTATHELRTPLTNIKAYAETLALDEQIDVEDQKKFCNIINSEVTRLSRFVDELLNVSQMEAGALALNLQLTDMERLFKEVIEHNRPQIEKKNIDFNSVIPLKLPEISIDKDKITASLVNLLGNAIKYTPNGGNVSFKVLHQNNSLVVEVEDKGYGISEEDQAMIFDKFYRSDDERVQAMTGSGLGLAFVQEAIRLHGGQLDVFSEIDKGSMFTLTLPI